MVRRFSDPVVLSCVQSLGEMVVDRDLPLIVPKPREEVSIAGEVPRCFIQNITPRILCMYLTAKMLLCA
jgi:hypothetical protein